MHLCICVCIWAPRVRSGPHITILHCDALNMWPLCHVHLCICIFVFVSGLPGDFLGLPKQYCIVVHLCKHLLCVHLCQQCTAMMLCMQAMPGEWTINRRRDINHKQIDTDGMHISTVENRYRLTAHPSTKATPMRLGSWLFPIVYFHMFPQNVCSRRFIVILFAYPSTEVNPTTLSSRPSVQLLARSNPDVGRSGWLAKKQRFRGEDVFIPYIHFVRHPTFVSQSSLGLDETWVLES